MLQRLNDEDQFIDSVSFVKKKLKDEAGLDMKAWRICKVMNDLGMRYRKVKHIPLQGNTDRSLVLRQQWAQKLFQLPHVTRLICLDETWLGMSDFRRRKWQARGSSNSVAAFTMVPRVTMLLAVDNQKRVYVSLAQANSNKRMFGMFIRNLVLKLDNEDPDWRMKSVVILDGASYH